MCRISSAHLGTRLLSLHLLSGQTVGYQELPKARCAHFLVTLQSCSVVTYIVVLKGLSNEHCGLAQVGRFGSPYSSTSSSWLPGFLVQILRQLYCCQVTYVDRIGAFDPFLGERVKEGKLISARQN